MRHHRRMSGAERLRQAVKRARKRRAPWVRAVDALRQLGSRDGRSQLLTRLKHGGAVHQTTVHTAPDRYPALFDAAAALHPTARRILSFGCATGEELAALRDRWPEAEIVGADINGRARRIARRRTAGDPRIQVVAPGAITGRFDAIFALAVLQREPHKIAELGLTDLTPIYPFKRFDAAVAELVRRLAPGGLLCVMHAQYRVEDSSAADLLEPVADPARDDMLFAPDGRPIASSAQAIFRRRPDA